MFFLVVPFSFSPPLTGCPLHYSTAANHQVPPEVFSIHVLTYPQSSLSLWWRAYPRNVSNLFPARPSISLTNFWLATRSFSQLTICIHSRRSLYTQRSTRYVANTRVVFCEGPESTHQHIEPWITASLQNAASPSDWTPPSPPVVPGSVLRTKPGYTTAPEAGQHIAMSRGSRLRWLV